MVIKSLGNVERKINAMQTEFKTFDQRLKNLEEKDGSSQKEVKYFVFSL